MFVPCFFLLSYQGKISSLNSQVLPEFTVGPFPSRNVTLFVFGGKLPSAFNASRGIHTHRCCYLQRRAHTEPTHMLRPLQAVLGLLCSGADVGSSGLRGKDYNHSPHPPFCTSGESHRPRSDHQSSSLTGTLQMPQLRQSGCAVVQ